MSPKTDARLCAVCHSLDVATSIGAATVYHLVLTSTPDLPDLDVWNCLEEIDLVPDLKQIIARAHSIGIYDDIRDRARRIHSQQDHIAPIAEPPAQILVDRINGAMALYVGRRGTQVLRTWHAPAHANRDVAAFYSNERQLPALGSAPETPALVVDGLGALFSDPVVRRRVDAVFTKKHMYFCNASGVGKTRIVLEGLTRYWGMYITCAQQPKGIGSADLATMIEEITHSPKFSAAPAGDTQEGQLEQNEDLVKRLVFSIILARVTILRSFLAAMQQQSCAADDAELRRLWVLLQVDPSILSLVIPNFSSDIFRDLAREIFDNHAASSSEAMFNLASDSLDHLFGILEHRRFYVVLDEAQDAARRYPEAFRSGLQLGSLPVPSAHGEKRPLLRELVVQITGNLGVTGHTNQAFLVMTGTSLTAEDVTSLLRDSSLSWSTLTPVTFGEDNSIGGFDTYEELSHYVLPYLPRERHDGKANRLLLWRMYKWLRGRYRFTVAYLSLLLKTGLRSPHRLLDLFVYACTGHHPSDGALSMLLGHGSSEAMSIFLSEPSIDENILKALTLESVSGIDFTKLKEKAHYQERLVMTVRSVIIDLINRSAVKVALGSEFSPEVVGMGLGRSSHSDMQRVSAADAEDSDDEAMDVDVDEQGPAPSTSTATPRSVVGKDPIAIINEPLVILALAHYFNSTALQSAYFHFASNIFVDGSKNNGWENYVAQSLILVLSSKDPVLLRELLIFRNTDNLPADSLARKNEGITVRIAYIFRRDGSCVFSSEFREEMPGTESKSFEETMEWLRDMTTPLLFPDQLFGPDLIFILRLSTGENVWVAVQCKYHSHPSPFLTSRLPTTNDAVRSTTPNKYYISKSSTPSEEENSRNEEVRRQLRALPGLTKNAGECGLIRAMAYIPSLADLGRSTLVDPDTGNHPVAEINLDFVRGRTKPFPPADVMAEALTKDGIEPINAKYAPETPFPLPENLSERYEQAWSYRQSIMEKKDTKGQLVAPRITDAEAAPAPRTRSAAKKRPRQSTESTNATPVPGIIAISPDSPSSKARVGRPRSAKRPRKVDPPLAAAVPEAQPSRTRGKSAKR